MCNCINDRKKDFELVRSLALKAVGIIQGNIRIFSRELAGIGLIYDFEPAEFESGNTEIEILNYTPEN